MMKRSNFLILMLILSGLLVFGVQTVSAQESQPTPSDDEVNRVAKQMYCPVCENIPLDVCPTTACAEWRELIRLRLSEGWTDEQIKEYFAAQYGDRVLAEPPRRGWNWLVYLLPWVFLAGGAVIVWRVLTNMKARSNPPSPDAAAENELTRGKSNGQVDDPYLAQIEEELRKHD